MASRRTGARLVTTFHGNYVVGSAVKRTYNQIMAQGERVIAVSDFMAEQIRTQYACPPSRIRVVYPGIATTVFDPASVTTQVKSALRAAWDIDDGGVLLRDPALAMLDHPP